MAQLQSMTNLPFTRFAGVMAKLDEAGLVKISGSPGSETVEITSAGVTLASLG
jgi:predicted transcriptional regulator